MITYASRELHPVEQGRRAPSLAAEPSQHPVLFLQGAAGNQATRLVLQAALRVSQPGDRYEQEAERIASHVLCMPLSPHDLVAERDGVSSPGSSQLRDRHRGPPQIARLRADQPADGIAPPIVADVLRSPGRPLEPATRAFMESRLGRDFSAVRVHSDPAAVQAARAVGARAFTVGSNVVFDGGEYAPGNDRGRRLLTHELVHVVQQSSAPGRSIQQPHVIHPSAAPAVQRTPAAPAAGVGAALALVGRALLACIIGAAFGVGLDYVFQRGVAWWRNQTFRWNTCYAIISGIVGCVGGVASSFVARALFRSTGGHLESGAVKAVVWVLTWLYGKFPVVPIAMILKQLVKLGCVDRSEVPAGVAVD